LNEIIFAIINTIQKWVLKGCHLSIIMPGSTS